MSLVGLYLSWLSVVSGPQGMYAGGLAVPMIRQSLLEVSAHVVPLKSPFFGARLWPCRDGNEAMPPLRWVSSMTLSRSLFCSL